MDNKILGLFFISASMTALVDYISVWVTAVEVRQGD